MFYLKVSFTRSGNFKIKAQDALRSLKTAHGDIVY